MSPKVLLSPSRLYLFLHPGQCSNLVIVINHSLAGTLFIIGHVGLYQHLGHFRAWLSHNNEIAPKTTHNTNAEPMFSINIQTKKPIEDKNKSAAKI